MEVEKKLSVEDLMKPRYKVINIDTSGDLMVGEILILDDEMNVFWCNGQPFEEKRLKLYPHLFKKLEWWQERKESDMPEYVKVQNRIYKVRKWIKTDDGSSFFMSVQSPDASFTLGNIYYSPHTPATESEYLTLNK